MKIQTEQFGEIEVNEPDVIKLAGGLLGFEENDRFVIIPFDKESPLSFLQSINEPSLAFIVINPMEFYSDYEPDIPDEDLKEIGVIGPEQVVLATLVTIPEKAQDMTTNLMAPIVLNKDSKKAKQVILQNQNYTTKHRLIAHLSLQKKGTD